jgi:hypothetical protein
VTDSSTRSSLSHVWELIVWGSGRGRVLRRGSKHSGTGRRRGGRGRECGYTIHPPSLRDNHASCPIELRLVKTNHDLTVRVSDKVDLDGLPYESNLLAVSNTWGLLIVGSNHGESGLHLESFMHRAHEE